MSRVVIVGGPKTGKTTLAKKMGGNVRHTDDLMKLGWSEASAEAAKWLDQEGPVLVEGVAGPRMLRKWMANNPGKPCDQVIVLEKPRTGTTPGQRTMAKGVHTVLNEIQPELVRRGVEIIRGDE